MRKAPLPVRDGLNPSRVRLPESGHWATTLDYLLQRFYSDQDRVREKVAAGEVVDGAGTPIDPKTPFDFVSTNDIVGGNSGSAVVNKKGELVGLIFDGNIQSLPGYFIYDEGVNRAVSVDSRAIMEALRKIYKTQRLVDEVTAARTFGTW